MILKLLLIAAVIFTVYILFFKQPNVTQKRSNKQKKQTQEPQPVNDLIECPTCGVYIEVEEAILSGSKYYCSTECIDKAS